MDEKERQKLNHKVQMLHEKFTADVFKIRQLLLEIENDNLKLRAISDKLKK